MKSSLRSLFLKIHIYAGLLCSSYLLIFGLSSLNYNHHFGKPSDSDHISWERRTELATVDGDDRAFTNRITERLGLIGWTIPWETYRDEGDNLHFGLNRPGKKYTVHVFFDEGLIRVEERRTGFWPIVNSLHALTRLPYSPFMSLWGVVHRDLYLGHPVLSRTGRILLDPASPRAARRLDHAGGGLWHLAALHALHLVARVRD